MKTTKASFNRFRKEFLRFVDKFGLKRWDVRLTCEKDGVNDATVELCSRGAVMAIANIDTDTSAKPEYCAKHEAFELLFAPIHELICKCNEVDYEKAKHEIIHVLESLIK